MSNRKERRKQASINRLLGKAYSSSSFVIDYAATVEPVEIELRAGLTSLLGDYEEINLDNEEITEELNGEREALKKKIKDLESQIAKAEKKNLGDGIAADAELEQTVEQIDAIRDELTRAKKDLVAVERKMRRAGIEHTRKMCNFLADTVLDLTKTETTKEEILRHLKSMGQMDLQMFGQALMAGKAPDPKEREGINAAYQRLLAEKINFDLTGDSLLQPSEDTTNLNPQKLQSLQESK